MKRFAQRIYQSAIAWNFLSTLLRVGASVFVLPLMLRKMPPEQLGLWYVFGTLGAFAMLLDLGFEATVTRMTAYVWAGATRLTAFGLEETAGADRLREPNRLLFAELLATLRAYYRALGLGVLLVLAGGGGAWIWIKTTPFADANSLRAAWLVYAVGCCLNFISGRWPALLTGVGALRTAQQVAIVALLLYYIAAVVGLLAGLGLWAMVIAIILMGMLARALAASHSPARPRSLGGFLPLIFTARSSPPSGPTPGAPASLRSAPS